MIKVLGFFNLFFGILEITGLFKYINGLEAGPQPQSLDAKLTTLVIYPLILLSVGVISTVLGAINLGALPPKSKKEEFVRTMLGGFLIFASTIVFWDLIIV
jgi:hypothetical protein